MYLTAFDLTSQCCSGAKHFIYASKKYWSILMFPKFQNGRLQSWIIYQCNDKRSGIGPGTRYISSQEWSPSLNVHYGKPCDGNILKNMENKCKMLLSSNSGEKCFFTFSNEDETLAIFSGGIIPVAVVWLLVNKLALLFPWISFISYLRSIFLAQRWKYAISSSNFTQTAIFESQNPGLSECERIISVH